MLALGDIPAESAEIFFIIEIDITRDDLHRELTAIFTAMYRFGMEYFFFTELPDHSVPSGGISPWIHIKYL